jgi:hypothetical protein
MAMRLWTGIVGGLAAVLLLAGCGETDKSVVPPPGNPFEAARVGADTTLEVMTWNIENFPKAGGATVNWVDQIIVGPAAGHRGGGGDLQRDLVRRAGGADRRLGRCAGAQ